MTLMMEQFRDTADLLGGGYLGEHMALGYGLTDGMLFPHVGGGTVLMRRRLYPTVEAWHVCGFVSGLDVSNEVGFGHEAGMAYQYAAAVMLGNGYASKLSEPIRVDFDDAGDLISPGLPMFPQHVSARALNGGQFEVSFDYDGYGQGGSPHDYQVFEGADAASVDWDTPLVDDVTGLDYVLYSRRHRLTFITGAFPDGSEHVFGVRARNAGGVSELNTFTSPAEAARASTTALTTIYKTSARRASS